MCYDISFSTKVELVTDYLPELDVEPQLKLSWEPVVHTQAQSFQKYPVLIFEDGTYKLKQFEWGVIAPYMNNAEKIKKQRPQMCNARAEKVVDKTSFWHRIRHTRCLVPVTGFFEHREIAGWKHKVPYYIRLQGRPLFCLAGLYHYPDKADVETGEITGTFTIITRAANEVMKQIHNGGDQAGRMPSLLPKEKELAWLAPSLTDAEMKTILDFEMPTDALVYNPVYTIRTTKPRPDDAEKTEPFEWAGLPALGTSDGRLRLF